MVMPSGALEILELRPGSTEATTASWGPGKPWKRPRAARLQSCVISGYSRLERPVLCRRGWLGNIPSLRFGLEGIRTAWSTMLLSQAKHNVLHGISWLRFLTVEYRGRVCPNIGRSTRFGTFGLHICARASIVSAEPILGVNGGAFVNVSTEQSIQRYKAVLSIFELNRLKTIVDQDLAPTDVIAAIPGTR